MIAELHARYFRPKLPYILGHVRKLVDTPDARIQEDLKRLTETMATNTPRQTTATAMTTATNMNTRTTGTIKRRRNRHASSKPSRQNMPLKCFTKITSTRSSQS